MAAAEMDSPMASVSAKIAISPARFVRKDNAISIFEVVSDTCEEMVYTVTLAACRAITCTCKDWERKSASGPYTCKHMERVNRHTFSRLTQCRVNSEANIREIQRKLLVKLLMAKIMLPRRSSWAQAMAYATASREGRELQEELESQYAAFQNGMRLTTCQVSGK